MLSRCYTARGTTPNPHSHREVLFLAAQLGSRIIPGKWHSLAELASGPTKSSRLSVRVEWVKCTVRVIRDLIALSR
jgi:hypothetical protein